MKKDMHTKINIFPKSKHVRKQQKKRRKNCYLWSVIVQLGRVSVLMYGCTTKRSEIKFDGITQRCCVLFKQMLEAAPYKPATVQPLTSHLTNHPNKTCWALLRNWGRTHKQRSPVDSSYTWTSWCWPTSKNSLSTNTRCRLGDLPRAIAD